MTTLIIYVDNANQDTFSRMVYELKFLRGNPQWHLQMTNFYGNSIPSILGIALGYAYYLKKDLAFIEKHVSYYVYLLYELFLSTLIIFLAKTKASPCLLFIS